MGLFLSGFACAYEGARRALLVNDSLAANPSAVHLAAGAAAGALTATLTTPSDVIRTRVQTQAGAAAQAGEHVSIMTAARMTMAEGGYRALFAGLAPRLAAYTPAGALTFFSYELYKDLVLDHL
jgi:solute carrier family 25 iron transporter 28/37